IGASLDLAEMISVPGATTSGLILLSSDGPLLLKPASASGSPDIVAIAIGPDGKAAGHAVPQVIVLSPPLVRSLRLAPTVSAFLAVAGAPIESQSTKPGGEFLLVAA